MVPRTWAIRRASESYAIGAEVNYRAVTASTVALGDDKFVLADGSSSSITLVLPSASQNPGKVYYLKKVDATTNSVILTTQSGDLVDGGSTATLTRQYEAVAALSDGSNWYIF